MKMKKPTVLRSFRIDPDLWEKFTKYCELIGDTATNQLTQFIESTVNTENIINTEVNVVFKDKKNQNVLQNTLQGDFLSECKDVIYTEYIQDLEKRLSLIESIITSNDTCKDTVIIDDSNCIDACNDTVMINRDQDMFEEKNNREIKQESLPCLPEVLPESKPESKEEITIVPDRQNEEQKEIKEIKKLNYKDSYLRIKELINEGKTKTTIHKDLQIKSIYPNYPNKFTKNEISFKWNKDSLKTFIERYERENSISENDSILKYF